MSDSLAQVFEITLTPVDNRRLANLCGRFDEHLRQIEHRLEIEITNRGNTFQLIGLLPAIHIATQVLKSLYEETKHNSELSPSKVHLALQQYTRTDSTLETEGQATISTLHTRAGEVRPRSPNQIQYIKNILSHDINFGIGPAGTGKTFLAVASAVAAFEQEKIRRILLVRPAVEAGEHLGFLPGDIAQKIDPYLRPLYDALYEMFGFERVAKLLERQVIEIASLAYMRGRTLNDAFIILDEAQNTTVEQMKMFLTRLGFSSTAVITGDITQIDLPKGKQSGLKQVMGILQSIPGISFTFFDSADVVRHPVVQKIIEAYALYDTKHNHPKGIPVSIELELQIATLAKTLPHPAQIREWVNLTLYNRVETAELTIRIVDDAESADLNQQYRNKPGPTNVLSFPYDPEPGIASRLLGDIVICAPVVEQEAILQNKSLLAHWAHMVIHGLLHLLGYTHDFDDDAAEMENLETELLLRL